MFATGGDGFAVAARGAAMSFEELFAFALSELDAVRASESGVARR